MAKRRHEKTVSLFPFLAVLVCTMGALILLLLVTTRRIRKKQQETTTEVAIAEPIQRPTDSIDSKRAFTSGKIAQSLAALGSLAITTGQRAEIERALEDQRQLYADASQQLSHHQRLLAESRQVLETLRQKQDAVSSDVVAEDQQLDGLHEQQISLRQRLNELRRSIDRSSSELFAAESLAVDAERLLSQRWSALQALRDLSVHQRDRVADTGVTETVIDFSNSAGTARTPIVVDVTDQGFLFPATRLTVRRKDMDGVSSTDNPLLSGVLAIHRARSQDSITSRPYVLLLVRPSGTLDFYRAQAVFKAARMHFGYELLGDDEVITPAQPVDGEVEALRTAVLDSLLRRDKHIEMTSSLRQRIAALRDAQRGDSRRALFGPGRREPATRRQYYGQPFEDADLNAGTEYPSEGSADVVAAEAAVANRRDWPESRTRESDGSPDTSTGPNRLAQSPEASAPVWKSIPSMAEARTHVEQALAKALAARDASSVTDSTNNVGSARSASSGSDRPTTFHPEPPAAGTHSESLPPDKPSNNLGRVDPMHDEFWTAMQPVTTQPALERPQNEWSSRTRNSTDQPTPFPTLNGEMYRSDGASSGSPSALNSPGAANAPTNSPFGSTAAGGSNASSGGLISYEQVTIYLDAQHYTIVGQRPVALHGQAISQITNSVAGGLFEISRRSPHPLAEVTLPAAKFVISPGAHTLYLQLAAELYDLNIPVSSIVSMDAHVTHRSTGFDSGMRPPEQRTRLRVSSRTELP